MAVCVLDYSSRVLESSDSTYKQNRTGESSASFAGPLFPVHTFTRRHVVTYVMKKRKKVWWWFAMKNKTIDAKVGIGQRTAILLIRQ